MFKTAFLGASALLGAWSPLSAQVFSISINGAVAGSQTTVMCSSGSGPTCLANNPSGVVTDDFAKAFDFSLFTTDLAQGDNAFSYGFVRSSGYWNGIINNSGGVLTGRDLTFSIEDPTCRFGAVGCKFAFASASSFGVIGGVPEPTTWATMLLGFLAVGLAVRKNPRRARSLAAG